MKRILSLAAIATLAWMQAGTASAAGIGAAIGQTDDSNLIYRLGAEWDFGRSWLQSDVGRLTGYWDVAYTYWDGDASSSNHSLSAAPVFVYQFGHGSLRPFVELGVGVAVFADTQVEDQHLGSAFQFEDRLGVGLRLGNGQRLGVRAMHYSNAGIKQPNDGVETYSLFYRAEL